MEADGRALRGLFSPSLYACIGLPNLGSSIETQDQGYWDPSNISSGQYPDQPTEAPAHISGSGPAARREAQASSCHTSLSLHGINERRTGVEGRMEVGGRFYWSLARRCC